MADHQPWADRLNDEVDAFFRLWRNRRWLAIIFVLVCLGVCVYFVIGWVQRGNKIDDLKSKNLAWKAENRELKRDLRQVEAENTSLRDTVAPLINQAVREFPGEEITEALKKIVARLESEDPLKKLIASASATVEISIESDKQINTHYADRGGYLAFAKGSDAILVCEADHSYARQTGKGEVIYRGVFHMPATDSAVGKPIKFLEDAEYLQISFLKIPKNSSVVSGKAIIVVNGSQRFEFPVPPQKMQEDLILVQGIEGFISSRRKHSTQPTDPADKQ